MKRLPRLLFRSRYKPQHKSDEWHALTNGKGVVAVDGAKAERPVNVEVIRQIVSTVKVPCQLGGGIRDEAAIRLMLDEVGVERDIVGTQALKHLAPATGPA